MKRSFLEIQNKQFKLFVLGTMFFSFNYVFAEEKTKETLRTPTVPQCKIRKDKAKRIRLAATAQQYKAGIVPQTDNGDLTLYPDHRASYSKGLDHDVNGFVTDPSFQSLLDAIASGDPADFDAIILGGAQKLTSPQAGWAFNMEGGDTWSCTVPPAPAFSSAEAAGEIVELYWASLLRDVSFNKYPNNPIAAQAVADLNNMSDFRGPKQGGNVTAGTLFRGSTPGELTGPYISQFLYLPVPLHEAKVSQEKKVPVSGNVNNFLTTPSDWLTIQNGGTTGLSIQFTSQPTFIKNGRDMGDYVHYDYPGELFINAALILLGFGPTALDDNNPYKNNPTQAGFITYAAPDILNLIVMATYASIKSTWFQKWAVHMRLRPEYFGGLVHKQLTIPTDYGIHDDLLNSAVLPATFSEFGSYLLAQQFPEGCPTHPSYPAGHATVAGACATMLKAFFKESFVIPNPVEPNNNNTALVPSGATLTVGGELNKLASNDAIGRNLAGVHYRSDAYQSMLLGEKVALKILSDEALTKNENFAGYTLTKFDGTTITVGTKKNV